MRELRCVGPAPDSGHLIVADPRGGERFTLLLDEVLRRAAANGARRPAVEPRSAAATPPATPGAPPIGLRSGPPSAPVTTAPAPNGEVAITPREIQVRVRAGESPDEVAAEFGVSVDRVMRFAGPVLAERARIADAAHRAKARRTSNEAQIVIFGEAVDERFSAYGVEPAEVGWDARRREDGDWQVTATWTRGEVEHHAQWLLHLATNLIAPLDDAGGDLLSDRPIRQITGPALGAAAPGTPLQAGVVAFPVMPDASTGPVPVLEDVFDQDDPPDVPRPGDPRPGDLRSVGAVGLTDSGDIAPSRAEPGESGDPHPATASGAVDPAGSVADVGIDLFEPVLADEPLPLELPPALQTAARQRPPLIKFGPADGTSRTGAARAGAPGSEKRAERESEEERAARTRIPSWDDILLGVRRKRDD